jgi:TPR repeat protein
MRWLFAITVVAGCAASTPSAEPYWRAPLARCEAGDERACAEVYGEYRGAFPPAHLREPAQRAASLSCARDLLEGCKALRRIVERGAARGELVAKGCRLGDAESCGELAHAYRFGDAQLGTTRDPASAAAYAVEGCRHGHAASCSLPLSLTREGAVTPSADVREEYMRLAFCRGREPSCTRVLAEHYAGATMGHDLVDLPRANALLDRACADGDAVACTRQATLVYAGSGVVRDRDRAHALWKRGCDGGDREGCFMLGRAHLVRGARYNASAAVAAFALACGEDAACLASAGVILAIKRERGEAAAQLARACALGSERACIDRGRVLVLEKKRTNPQIADLERACDGEERTACHALAHAYRHGLGVRSDAARATRYAKRASSLRLSSRYWAALSRGANGTGSAGDTAVFVLSVSSVAPLVAAGWASLYDDRWDFSEASYSDP